MPHLTLEYSANVESPSDLPDLFARLHHVLAEVGGIKIENCKTRSRKVRDFLVATGGESQAFVHLDVRFLEGRPPETRQEVGEALLEALLQGFRESVERLELQVTVEIQEIARAGYFKYPKGTLTPT